MTFPTRIAQLPPFDGPFAAYGLAGDGCDVLVASRPAGTVIGDQSHATHNVGVIRASSS